MFRSLIFQVLWAPALALGLAGAGLATQAAIEAHGRIRREPIELERSAVVDRARLLANRHRRTVERVRGAILDSRPNSRISILNYTSAHYLKRMRSLTDGLRSRLEALNPVDGAANLEERSERLRSLLDSIDGETTLVADAVEHLRSALESDDTDEFERAQIEFERAEVRVSRQIANLDGGARRLMKLRSERRLSPVYEIPSWIWIALGLIAIGALAIAGHRLRRIAEGGNRSDIEALIQQRRDDAKSRIHELETELARINRSREVSEQALRREEYELALLRIYNENLVNSLRSAVVVTDLQGNVSGFNRTARQLLSPERGGSVYAHPLGRTVKREVTGFERSLAQALDDRKSVRASALHYDASREQLIDVSVTPYLDERGAARGLLWVVDDVTENVNTKNRLLAAERLAAVGRLSAQVAHEIRNPLSAIGLNAELLEDELDGNSGEARSLLRAIAGEIERLTEVTEGYLQLTRNPEPHATQTDINEAIRDLLSMLGPEFRSHGIELSLELDAADTVAWVDPGQLRQALLNVLRNAREAMPEGGSITLATGRVGNLHFIDVTDQGPGIPDEQRERVFEPFFTTKAGGTGLGLSLTQQIVRELHGDVEIRPADTAGVTVRIVLPTEPADHAAELS